MKYLRLFIALGIGASVLGTQALAQSSWRKITVNGMVTVDKNPAPSVPVTATSADPTVSAGSCTATTTTSTGSFSCRVPRHWTGSITATQANVVFAPVKLADVTTTQNIAIAGLTQTASTGTTSGTTTGTTTGTTSGTTTTTTGTTSGTTTTTTTTTTTSGGTTTGTTSGTTSTTTAAGTFPWPVWTPAIPAVPPSSTGNTYYVAKNGNDANDGRSRSTAFATIRKAVSVVAAGDTVLIGAGLYREGINLGSGQSGVAGKPITFGSYGDGEVILDGSTKVGPWTVYSGSVWKAPVPFTPIGVVVNEVPLKQVTQGQGGSTAPQVGLSGVTSGSGKWYVGGGYIYADMGTTLGSGDPNTADIVVPNNVGDQQHVFFWGNYLVFKGLTVRGSGSNGIWGYGSHVTVESCNIKFNGKAAVSFQMDSGGTGNTDNAVITSHIYHNVLRNWPRGNNGYAEAGGGWSGGIAWITNLRPVARGNIVHMNGGEGIISWGTQSGHPSGYALFEQNISYDNWSVNMYFDNQPYDVARNNLIFNHPPNPANYLYVGAYPYDSLGKYTVCMMLADEQWSSDATNNYANLNYTQVYNNILAGCRIGIRDYSEGSSSVANHGLKNTVIANNTIIMPYSAIPGTYIYGIFLQDNVTPSGTNRNTNSRIQDNIVYGFNNDPLVASVYSGPLSGISLNYNDYYSTGSAPFSVAWNTYNFSGWKSILAGSDTNSKFQDPLLADISQFRLTGTSPYDYTKAMPSSGSPVLGAGTPQSAFSNNYLLQPRSTWNIGAF